MTQNRSELPPGRMGDNDTQTHPCPPLKFLAKWSVLKPSPKTYLELLAYFRFRLTYLFTKGWNLNSVCYLVQVWASDTSNLRLGVGVWAWDWLIRPVVCVLPCNSTGTNCNHEAAADDDPTPPPIWRRSPPLPLPRMHCSWVSHGRHQSSG